MTNGKNGKAGKNGNGNRKSGKAAAAGTTRDWLEHFALSSAIATGRPGAFLVAAALVILWAVTGPLFDFSDSWQLVINTGTTIVTFLMVFLIQRAQNRDTMALQAKLAELIIAVKGAKNEVAVAEDFSEHELKALHDLHSEEAQQRLDRMEDEAAAMRAGKRKTAAAAK
jgi:low affinity Fe/Cu permease